MRRLAILAVLAWFTAALADEAALTNRMHQGQCADVVVPAFNSTEACVTWAWPFARCSSSGSHPYQPCTQNEVCGTSVPCSAEDYEVLADVRSSEASADAPTLRVHHITRLSADRACALVINEDAVNAKTGTLCLEALAANAP